MIYLKSFDLMSCDAEERFLNGFRRTCFDSYYPLRIFSSDEKNLRHLEFSDITIFCGGNGSGKSTLLNIIAEKLELNRQTCFNRTYFFDPYLDSCEYDFTLMIRDKYDFRRISRIITSDDVFNHIIEVRQKNEKLGFKRDLIFDEKSRIFSLGGNYNNSRPRRIEMDNPQSLKAFSDYVDFNRKSASRLVRENLGVDERTYSNGENGFKYFTDAILPGGLYLLDEPENSLSAEMQLNLVQFLHGMASHYDCQFILSSHSPFVLSIPGALIYNLDAEPVCTCKWTDLPNIKIYHEFFQEHQEEFVGKKR